MFKNLIRLLKCNQSNNRLILPQRRNFNNFSKFQRNLKYSCVVKYETKRDFHKTNYTFAKVYVDRENEYLYTILKLPKTAEFNKLDNNITSNNITNNDELNAFLKRNWRKKSSKEIVDAFNYIKTYCKLNNIDLSSERFDGLTVGLLDIVQTLTDTELLLMLDIISEFPPCDSFKSHNFHDIWSALDDVCCWRIVDWELEMMLTVADKWFNLNLGKVSDYIFEVLNRCAKKSKKLTNDQLLHAFFLMNICRKRPVDFEFEAAVQTVIDDLTIDQMAIIALGYFKTQSKVKIPEILSSMMRKAQNADKVHEMTLCAILKIVRFTSTPFLSDQIYDFLKNITPTLHAQSNMCLIHTALLGTTLQIMHQPSLKIAAQRIIENAHDVDRIRLKDLERILLPFSIFDYDPKTTPDFYETIFNELHSDERQKEIAQYPRCMPSALLFLSVRNMYSYELLSQILHKDFITDVYGNGSKLPRELFSLDLSVEIECPDYKGNRLSIDARRKSAKWLTSYAPTRDQPKRLSKADLIALDVMDNVVKIVEHEKKIFTHHILPHFGKADMILCKDKKTNKFVVPFGFDNYVLGDIMRPADLTNYSWYAIVVISWNSTIRDTTFPVGSTNMKLRQLEKIGFQPVPIIWNEYMPLQHHEKMNYILYKLESASKQSVANVV